MNLALFTAEAADVGAAAVQAGAPSLWHWLAFGAFVAVVLTLDLVVFHRHAHEPSLRESAFWTAAWCALALAFDGLMWWWRGAGAATDFLTGYLLEWSLSMDNVFVFAVVFSFFGVPVKYQYRVLFWGILGAVGMRLAFVLVGAVLIERFAFILPIFGLILVYTGVKLAVQDDADPQPDKNVLLRLARRLFPVSTEPHGDKFFVVENGRRCITPLFLVLLVIESTDVVFAFDSVPAIFGVTKDPFVVFTSNIFAILGLRALYFLLAGVMDLFRYLKYGLSAVLVFIGLKMLAESAAHSFAWIGEHDHLMPSWVSLLVVTGLIGLAIGASLLVKPRNLAAPPGGDAHSA